MKILLSIVALVACFVFASDAFAQGGSAGTRGVVVREYAVRQVAVRDVRVREPRARLAWFPRRIATAGGSAGTSVSVQVGGSAGNAGLGKSASGSYQAPAASADVSVSIQQHSQLQASQDRMFHSRGGWARGIRFEGVGFSTESPQRALENCCYFGAKQLAEQSIVRGRRGWYATARYF